VLVPARPADRVEIDAGVRAAAATYREPNLRRQDAIHMATAQLLGAGGGAQLEAFVTYDDCC
jgi:predicted nucleic acid-binding protein